MLGSRGAMSTVQGSWTWGALPYGGWEGGVRPPPGVRRPSRAVRDSCPLGILKKGLRVWGGGEGLRGHASAKRLV